MLTHKRKTYKLAFLIFDSLKASHRKNKSFDGMINIGAKIIEEVLINAGYHVDRCVPELACEYDLVLVSFTSVFDLLSFYKSVALLKSWQPGTRKFKVLAGGFGMQNPSVVRNFVDFAVFGRAHNWIVDVVDDILSNQEPMHTSLMHLPDISNVEIYQDNLYTETDIKFKLGHRTVDYSEKFTGCPLKCKFCHYTFARKHEVADKQDKHDYVQMMYKNDNSPELTFDQLFVMKQKMGRPRVAIDGFSERLRYLYGKRIRDQEITEGINSLGQFGGKTMLKMYNISNFPGETEDDRMMLYEAIRKADPKGRVVVDLHSTPFRPSLATPMQWEKVTLFPQWSDIRYTNIVAGDRHSETGIRAYHSKYLDSAYTHLIECVIIRATENTDDLFHAIALASKLQMGKATQKIKRIEANFDIAPYVKEYDIDDPAFPVLFLNSYIKQKTLERIAKNMRSDRDNPNWKPSGKSLVQIRLK